MSPRKLITSSTAVEREPLEDLLPSFAKDAALTKKKRKQIVEAACSLFFKKGYHGTTVRDIATVSGMSMGQLYHYISSKDDILFLIYKHMQELWHQHLLESGIHNVSEPVERLKRALKETISFMMENRKLLLFIYTESKYLDKRHLGSVLATDNEEVVGFWRTILGEVSESERLIGDIDLLANIVSYLMVFFPMRGWNLKEVPSEEVVNGLTDFILRGLGL